MVVGLMTSATGLKAQTLIAHFPLDEDGDSAAVGGFNASEMTDVEFGSGRRERQHGDIGDVQRHNEHYSARLEC